MIEEIEREKKNEKEPFYIPPPADPFAEPYICDVPPGTDGVELRDMPVSPGVPEMARGGRHMGYREAVDIFMRLAKSHQRTAEEVTALEMGARAMCRRHFQRQRNWARRREAANAEGSAE